MCAGSALPDPTDVQGGREFPHSTASESPCTVRAAMNCDRWQLVVLASRVALDVALTR